MAIIKKGLTAVETLQSDAFLVIDSNTAIKGYDSIYTPWFNIFVLLTDHYIIIQYSD
jgi:hypothetical protein